MLGPIIKMMEPSFGKLEIPDTWHELEDFTQWYFEAGMPFSVPAGFKVSQTDNAYSAPLFRHKNFQVEIYLIKQNYAVPQHQHPFVEVQTVILGGSAKNGTRVLDNGYEIDAGWGAVERRLLSGMCHGLEDASTTSNGSILLSFERWPEDVTPFTVGAVWKGGIVGPLHEKLIRSYFPDAYIKDGYADITRTMSDA